MNKTYSSIWIWWWRKTSSSPNSKYWSFQIFNPLVWFFKLELDPNNKNTSSLNRHARINKRKIPFLLSLWSMARYRGGEEYFSFFCELWELCILLFFICSKSKSPYIPHDLLSKSKQKNPNMWPLKDATLRPSRRPIGLLI